MREGERMGEDLGEGRGEKVRKERKGKKREKEKGGDRREETGKEKRSERRGEERRGRKMKEGNILSPLWPIHPHQICHGKEVGCLLVVESHQLPPLLGSPNGEALDPPQEPSVGH